ncbi:hypothetical protein QAD02_021043 [Eretmocerus hayati]|uniref:Uncharacterized protein n=1 Tax=Eretmocerus hayati TaxID=131215 RepID=A0ACC2PPB5_9HYME|nr:hypothetical protein QAD02_021043 [Eretmocerus hayati]
MGNKITGKAQNTNRLRSNSLGIPEKSIREFLSPRPATKRGVNERSPDSALLGNINKNQMVGGSGESESKEMDEQEYMSKGLADIIKEIQKLEKKFDKKFDGEREGRSKNLEAVNQIAEQIGKEDERKEKIWEARWEQLEKDDGERNQQQEQWERRLTRIEKMIEEKGEEMGWTAMYVPITIVIGTYMNRKKDKNWKRIAEETEKNKGQKIILLGDLNARTGTKGGDASKQERRKSRDKEVNKEGLRLIAETEKQGLMIVNGDIEGDEEGEYTYIGPRGNTVMNYAITNKKGRKGIKRMSIGQEIESDYLPSELELDVQGTAQNKREKIVQKWEEKAREQYRKRLENWKPGRITNWWDEECWMKEEQVMEAVEKKERTK